MFRCQGMVYQIIYNVFDKKKKNPNKTMFHTEGTNYIRNM